MKKILPLDKPFCLKLDETDCALFVKKKKKRKNITLFFVPKKKKKKRYKLNGTL
jgi:hypothetical protein